MAVVAVVDVVDVVVDVVDVVEVELKSPGKEGATLAVCGSWQETAGQKSSMPAVAASQAE